MQVRLLAYRPTLSKLYECIDILIKATLLSSLDVFDINYVIKAAHGMMLYFN
jgi:hypothetical protein